MNTTPDMTEIVSERRLWYGVAAPMAAWIAQGMTSFVISDAACAGGHIAPWAGMSARGLQTTLIVITLVMLALSVSGGLVAWKTWRGLSDRELERAEGWGRGQFMSLAGIFLGVVFTIGILWAGLAPILTGLCETTR